MATAMLTKPLVAGVGARARVVVRSRAPTRVFASADRTLWLPGAKAPSHLKGELPGDAGFDPVRVSRGVDPGADSLGGV